jgi:SAM-dependent methyltransferase
VQITEGRGGEPEMVTREQVVYAYRFFFGRDPESEAVIQRWLRLSDWATLRDAFMISEEFQQKFGARLAAQAPHEFLLAAPNHVDVVVSEEHFAKLFTHVRRAWEALGTRQPHWSVLTDPRFLPENVGENLENFYESGAQSWALFERSMARGEKTISREWTVFELGCGVGRVTTQLSKRFSHVTACDISHTHLALAAAHLREIGASNVQLSRLDEIVVLEALQPFDLFYSIIVLQHNPPPLMYQMLKLIFQKVKRGGCVYFQLPVAAKNYEFRMENYLSRLESAEAVMEMHVLPQPQLFQLMDESGLRILDLQRDNLTGPGFHSITILAEKVE